MSYQGIDYGLGRSNIDNENGIRYGVISQHSVNDIWNESSEADYGKPHCPKCGNEILASDDESLPDGIDENEWFDRKDYTCVDCETCHWSEDCFGDEPIGYDYSDSEYTLTDCLHSDIFVLKSPYYTYAQFCSPCVPGAGNLDTPIADGIKTYALGHEWFDGDKAPYTVYRVSDDSEVLPTV